VPGAAVLVECFTLRSYLCGFGGGGASRPNRDDNSDLHSNFRKTQHKGHMMEERQRTKPPRSDLPEKAKGDERVVKGKRSEEHAKVPEITARAMRRDKNLQR